MTTQAVARLAKELKELDKNPVGGFKCELADEDNLFSWMVYIEGPEGTMYEGGIFKVAMKFPNDYPNNPPSMQFLSGFWHPNVYDDGRVCISILHNPDPSGQSGESDAECWRPIQTVESVLVSVISMLSDPNFSSPANVDASVQLRKDPDAYKRKVKRLCEESMKALPKGFEVPKAKKPVVEDASNNIWDMDDEFDSFDPDDYITDDEDGEDDEEDDGEEDDEDEGEEEEEGEDEGEDGEVEMPDSQIED